MYLACKICDTVGIVGVCDKCKHVEKKFNDLEDRLHKADALVYWTQEKMKTLLRLVCEEVEAGVENVSVPSHLLKDLIEVANPYKKKEDFWTDTLLAHQIICDAGDMLRSHGTKMFPKVFGMLKKHIEKYYELHGWNKPVKGARLSRNIWDAEPVDFLGLTIL